MAEAKIKVVIRDRVAGVKYDVYKRFLWIWWHEYGYKNLTSCFFIFEDDIKRLGTQYGTNLIVDNRSKLYTRGLPRDQYFKN